MNDNVEGYRGLIFDSYLLHDLDLVTRLRARLKEIEAEKCDYDAMKKSMGDPAPKFFQREVCRAIWLD